MLDFEKKCTQKRKDLHELTPRGTHRPSSPDWSCQADPHVETLTYSLTSCSPYVPPLPPHIAPKTNCCIKRQSKTNNWYLRSKTKQLLMFRHLSLSQVSYIRQSLVRWSVKRAKYGFVFQIFVHSFDFSTLLTWMKQLNKVHFDNLPFSNNFGPFSPFQSFEVLHWLSTLWDHLRVTVASDKLYLLGKEYFWTEILPFSHHWETS